MTDKKLQRISAFEWASVTHYIIYISGAAGLLEVNSDAVNCLPLAKVGPAKLLTRKLRVSVIIKSNLSALERFVERYKGQLDDDEMVVIRGIYRQYRDNLQTVEGHMEVIKSYAQSSNKDMFEKSEVKDVSPF